jgi:hypothetical protein
VLPVSRTRYGPITSESCREINAMQPSLFKKAAELGATHVSAFTDKVTHLIAEDHGGAKYTASQTKV